MGYIGTSTHKRKVHGISALPSAAHFPCSMSKACVSTALKYSYFFSAFSTQMPCISLNQQQWFAQQSIAVPPAKISARPTPVHPEQLKKKSPFQRDEPDGREEDHSCGQHGLSMSSDDQTDRLHHRLAAAAKNTNPDSKSTRRTPFHISEL